MASEEETVDALLYNISVMAGYIHEQNGSKRSTIIDAEYTHVDDSEPQPLTDTEVIHMKAEYISTHSAFSFEECVMLLNQKSSWDIIALDPIESVEVFYRAASVEASNTDNNDPKWWHGLERQRRYPCATNQRRLQKKHIRHTT